MVFSKLSGKEKLNFIKITILFTFGIWCILCMVTAWIYSLLGQTYIQHDLDVLTRDMSVITSNLGYSELAIKEAKGRNVFARRVTSKIALDKSVDKDMQRIKTILENEEWTITENKKIV